MPRCNHFYVGREDAVTDYLLCLGVSLAVVTGDGRWDAENGIYGNGIGGVKQNPQTKIAELVDYYGPSNAEWLLKRDLDMNVTPVVFPYKGRDLIVGSGKEGRFFMLSSASLGGAGTSTSRSRIGAGGPSPSARASLGAEIAFGAAGAAPVKAGPLEDLVETLALGLRLDLLGARHDHRVHVA